MNLDANRQNAPEITRLLVRWADGESGAAEALLPLIYDQLRVLARRVSGGAESAAALQPTELVAEAWLRLDQAELGPMHRAHFLALAARVMRQVLVDHARRRGAGKRGGGAVHVTLSGIANAAEPEALDMLTLDEGLDRLARVHPRAAEAIELHYFGGLTGQESAERLAVTARTVERDLRFGRAWLKNWLDAA